MSTDKSKTNKTNIIEISKLNKWYGDFHALKNIDLEVKEGEIIVVNNWVIGHVSNGRIDNC